MKPVLFFSFLFILFFNQSQAQNQLYGLQVLNPKVGNWSKTPAYFESVELTITPVGLFSKVDILAEVSAKYTSLQTSSDSLEIEYKFSLPDGAIIHEAFLWMYNIPVRGELYEKGRAQFIYESLVNRRIDPIIVYKTDANAYEARIFPVLNPSPRKFLLSVLIPNQYTNNGWKLPLNLDLFRCDINGITTPVKLKVINNSLLGSPTFETTSYGFTTNGTVSEATIPATAENEYLVDGIYFVTNPQKSFYSLEPTATANEYYYQLSLDQQTELATNRNVLFTIDFTTDAQNKLSYTTFLEVLKKRMLSSLNQSDSFNVIYTDNGSVYHSSQIWQQATIANINAAFNTISATPLNSKALTENCIDSSVSFINKNGEKGTIMLFSNSKKTGSINTQQVNLRINAIKAAMKKNYAINVLDLNSIASNSYTSGQYFLNNQYFLGNLSSVTGGYYYTRFAANTSTYYYYNYPLISFNTVMDVMMNAMAKPVDYMYLVKTETGNSYNDFKMGNALFSTINERHMELGKYQGSASDISIVKHFAIGGIPFSDTYNLSHTVKLDSMLQRSWGYELIKRMISQNSNNLYTSHIINKSIEHHVLCDYTAFLALEPDSLSKTIANSNPTSVMTVTNNDVTLNAYPNPFSQSIQFDFKTPAEHIGKEWELTIYDLVGRTIRKITGTVQNKSTTTVTWNGVTNEGISVTDGIYIAKLSVGTWSETIKIIKN